MNIQMYDAQADTIKVDDIANDDNNRAVLDRIKLNEEGDNYTLSIQNQHFDEGEDELIYVPEGAKDMGWLGYFVGKSDCVEELYINDFDLSNDIDVVEPFIRGLNCNKSIYKLNIDEMDLLGQLGGKIFTMLSPFFKNNDNLKVLQIENCDFGVEESRALALALGSCKDSSLTKLFLVNNDIGSVDIVTALSMHPNLQHIDFEGNCVGRNGCIAMATLLEHSVTQLEVLDLGSNELDDEGIDALVPALKKCSHLNTLRLFNNSSITTRGWQHLASILKSPTSNLSELNLTNNNVDDEAAAEIASSLRKNSSLINLSLGSNHTITEKGWESFSRLLCDTTSVNSTFLSNHTLRTVNGGMGTGEDTNMNADQINTIGHLLELNERNDKKQVAMIKILKHHNDFDMMPFFEWEFKVLPLMINWLERASAITIPIIGRRIGPRKLSSIYQFVRGMPLLYVETRLKKELEDIEDEESQMEEKFRQRKQFLRDRKRSIVERLGPQQGGA